MSADAKGLCDCIVKRVVSGEQCATAICEKGHPPREGLSSSPGGGNRDCGCYFDCYFDFDHDYDYDSPAVCRGWRGGRVKALRGRLEVRGGTRERMKGGVQGRRVWNGKGARAPSGRRSWDEGFGKGRLSVAGFRLRRLYPGGVGECV